jgi:Ni,Fe-hydrogenase III large subunit
LFGDETAVHLAIRDPLENETALLTCECAGGIYPSVAARHPPAMRFERTIRDLFGLEPTGLPDARPWLDHGRFGVKHPLAAQRANPGEESYAFLPAEGESLHQIAVGPVHAGIIEPGFFLFTANGETVVRLEERLGYVHKGIESLMTGADLDRGIQLAARTSGDSTVAYGWAFAAAAEAAIDVSPPPRATWLRALMAELERIANHLGDIGAICNDASFAIMLARCAVLRERVLRSARVCFGHRLMRDVIAVGGVACDIDAAGTTTLLDVVAELEQRLPQIFELYDKTASLQDRTVGAGILKPELARQYACGGFIGRASGRAFDARKAPGYAPYDRLAFDTPVLSEGDVNARVWIRFREIEQSLSLVRQILGRLPSGLLRSEIEARAGEGASLIEGFRGDIFAWVRIGADGRIVRCHLRDPSWFQWPLLEASIEGNIVADFPLCNKSFNCSYSGHDL